MTIELVNPPSGATRQEIEEEATRLFAFVAADAETRDVQILDATWLERD